MLPNPARPEGATVRNGPGACSRLFEQLVFGETALRQKKLVALFHNSTYHHAMSYLVLARKYRPQTFAEVVGQPQIIHTLVQAIAKQRIHHAFLFCGARGTGKTTTARILAKALCCLQGPTSTPCNQCESCVEITQGTSVDVQEMDAASQNKVEDIRELRESIRYAPVRGKKKIFILDEVHMLSNSAFNALLKTLEEPPPHAVFILATTDPHKLPATILSRVQRYDFRLVSTAVLLGYLEQILQKENIPFETKALLPIVQESGGSVRDALSLLDQVLASHPEGIVEEQVAHVLGVADRSLLFALGQAVTERTAHTALRWVHQAYEKGYDLPQLAKALLGHLRDIVVAGTMPDPKPMLEATADEIEVLQKRAQQLGAHAAFLFQRMLKLAEEVARSPFPRPMLEVGLVELCLFEPLVPLSQLVAQLEQLQSGKTPSPASPPFSPKTSLPLQNPPLARKTAESSSGDKPREATSTPSSSTTPPPLTPEAEKTVSRSIPTETSASALSPTTASEKSSFAWEPLVQRILEQAPLLHILAMAHPMEWTHDQLVLGMDNQFLVDQLRAKLPELQKHLRAILNRSVQIQVAVSTKNQPSSLLYQQQVQQENEREQRKQEALQHPARQVLMQVFGSDVVFQEPRLELEET